VVGVVHHPIDAFGRHALDLEERLVVADAVVAGVELGHHDDDQLQVLALHPAGGAQLHQHRHEVAQRLGHMGENRHLVAEGAVFRRISTVDGGEIGWQFLGVNVAYARHCALLGRLAASVVAYRL